MTDATRPAPLPTTGSRSASEVRQKRRGRLAAVIALFAGLLGTLSCLAPWWYLATPTARVEYFPGSEVYVTSGGGGGVTTYAASGVASVGDLYELVVVGAILFSLIGWAVGGYGVAWPLGRGRGRLAGRVRRVALVAALVAGVLLVSVVPFAQPALYSTANPGRACTSPSPPGACTSYWGSATGGSGTTYWGAGAGWWLCAVSTGLLAVAFALRPRVS